MPKPFPWPLNVGTDICSIPRILGILSGNTSLKFVRRILTVEERNHYQARVDWPLSKWQETVRRQEQIERKRNDMGLSRLELAHCYDLKKAGKMGRPSVWLQQFRSRRHASAASRERNEAASSSSNQSKESFNVDGVNTKSTIMEDSRLSCETTIEASAHILDGGATTINVKAMPSTVNNGLDDMDAMLCLVHENDEAAQEAEKALRKAAEFMAGRYVSSQHTLFLNQLPYYF